MVAALLAGGLLVSIMVLAAVVWREEELDREDPKLALFWAARDRERKELDARWPSRGAQKFPGAW